MSSAALTAAAYTAGAGKVTVTDGVPVPPLTAETEPPEA
jgi:hypothetical protein